MQRETFLQPVFSYAGPAHQDALVEAKPLRPQLTLQLDRESTILLKLWIFGLTAATIKCFGEFVKVLPLRRRRLLNSRKGGRCREQQQGDNEVFHGLIRGGQSADYRARCQGCQYA